MITRKKLLLSLILSLSHCICMTTPGNISFIGLKGNGSYVLTVGLATKVVTSASTITAIQRQLSVASLYELYFGIGLGVVGFLTGLTIKDVLMTPSQARDSTFNKILSLGILSVTTSCGFYLGRAVGNALTGRDVMALALK